jgi:hypothetical protein
MRFCLRVCESSLNPELFVSNTGIPRETPPITSCFALAGESLPLTLATTEAETERLGPKVATALVTTGRKSGWQGRCRGRTV